MVAAGKAITVAKGMFIPYIPMALPSSLLENHWDITAGIAVVIKTPPMPKINLPIRTMTNEFATAVIKQPTAVKLVDTKPISLTQYLPTDTPTGMAKKIPGIITTEISKPASA